MHSGSDQSVPPVLCDGESRPHTNGGTMIGGRIHLEPLSNGKVAVQYMQHESSGTVRLYKGTLHDQGIRPAHGVASQVARNNSSFGQKLWQKEREAKHIVA